MARALNVVAVSSAAMLANVPLGIWRSRREKFAPQWFVAIVYLRKRLRTPRHAIPLNVGCAIMKQWIGGACALL